MDTDLTEPNDGLHESVENPPEKEKDGYGEMTEESNNLNMQSAPLFTEPIEQDTTVSNNSDNNDSIMKPKKRRLGMTGPAFTKSTLSVNLEIFSS